MSKSGIPMLLIYGAMVLVTSICTITAKASATQEIALPGTGVAMTLPEGVVVAPIGTMFTDPAREVVVVIAAGSVSRDQSKNPLMRALYPDPVESFRSPKLDGDLYSRTRTRDRGTFDGWWLIVHKGNQVLDVKISYSGSNPSEFLRLKHYLSTISWDGRLADPEIAFGLKLNVPGFKIIRAGFGALSYSIDGQPSENSPHLLAFAIPAHIKGDVSNFHRFCEITKSSIERGKLFSQIRYRSGNRMTVCDAWSLNTTPAGQDYYAALMLPDASVVQVVGRGDHDVFQDALLKACVFPREMPRGN